MSMKRELYLFIFMIANIVCNAQYVPNPTIFNPDNVVNYRKKPNNVTTSEYQINELKRYFDNIKDENLKNNQLLEEKLLLLNKPKKSDFYYSSEFATKSKSYNNAFNTLKNMLTGKIPLSVKDAYYEIESANGNTFLSKEEYNHQIKKSSNFIKQWLAENKFDLKNNVSLNYGIQRFMSDTLTINKKPNKEMPGIKPLTHLGFYYDFQDYKAQKDERSYYVSKTFATGNGQCHTLPVVYLILAEQLGAKAYLSYAPIHSFIKYPDNKSNIHNYEVTTNWQISDQWYQDNFNIKSLAIKSGIYLNSMNTRQVVACAVLDLAASYYKRFGVADGSFITQCVDFAMDYFPGKEANITGWLMRYKVASVKLNRVYKAFPNKSKGEIAVMPGVREQIENFYMIEEKIESLGYEPLSDSLYNKLLQYHNKKADIQYSKQFDNLKKRDLFINHKQ